MAVEIKTARTIALSEETAMLFAAKKSLDECFGKISNAHDRIFAHDEEFDEKLGKAYISMNNIIMDVIAEQIDNVSTDSNYKVI